MASLAYLTNLFTKMKALNFLPTPLAWLPNVTVELYTMRYPISNQEPPSQLLSLCTWLLNQPGAVYPMSILLNQWGRRILNSSHKIRQEIQWNTITDAMLEKTTWQVIHRGTTNFYMIQPKNSVGISLPWHLKPCLFSPLK